MLATHTSREHRIADLEIHGWTAVRDQLKDHRSFRGIWNAQLQIGFAVSRSIAGQRVIRLDADSHPSMVPEECGWGMITDEVLDAIDARLAEV